MHILHKCFKDKDRSVHKSGTEHLVDVWELPSGRFPRIPLDQKLYMLLSN